MTRRMKRIERRYRAIRSGRSFVGDVDLRRCRDLLGLKLLTELTGDAGHSFRLVPRKHAAADHLDERGDIIPSFLAHGCANSKKNFERFGSAVHHASVRPLFTLADVRVNRLGY